MDGWITGGWYYPQQAPSQPNLQRLQVQPGGSAGGDQPPPSARALVVLVVALWAGTPDPAAAYQLNQRAGGIAPLAGAAVTPSADFPPFAQYRPVIAADPQRPVYGVSWQYGRAPYGGATANAVVNVPPLFSIAQAYAARSTWPQDAWAVQRQSPSATTPNAPGPSVDQPPPLAYAISYALRNAWPIDAWNTARPFPAATTVSGPAQVQIPRGPYANSIPISWTTQPTWPAQRAVSTLVQPYPGDEPPGTYGAPDLAAFDLYPTWPTQRAAGVAATLPQPIVNPPPQTSFALSYAIRGIWPQDAWISQRAAPAATTPNAPAPVVNNPPPSGRAGGYALRTSWPVDAWNAERSAPTAPFELAPPSPPVPSSNALLYALRASWGDPGAAWAAQAEEPVAAVLPLPEVDQPPPMGWRIAYQLVSMWPVDAWRSQHASPFIATATVSPGLASPERVIVAFDGRRVPIAFDSRRIAVANDTRRIQLEGLE